MCVCVCVHMCVRSSKVAHSVNRNAEQEWQRVYTCVCETYCVYVSVCVCEHVRVCVCVPECLTHSGQVGIGVQGGSGLWSPPDRSDREYLMLVYSRPLILLFYKRHTQTAAQYQAHTIGFSSLHNKSNMSISSISFN